MPSVLPTRPSKRPAVTAARCENGGPIAVLGLSPAFDAVVPVDRFPAPGAVLREGVGLETIGGKGVNVARWFASCGRSVSLGGFVGRSDASRFARELRACGVRDAMLRVPGSTRRNATFVAPDGAAFKSNAPAFPALAPEDWSEDQVLRPLLSASRSPALALLCGSLPSSVPSSFFASAARRFAAAGASVAVDSSGPALRATWEAGPDLMKPNRAECEELLGCRLASERDVLRALVRLLARVPRVLLSDGSKGCWFAERGEGPRRPRVWHAAAPRIAELDATGSGDALLATFCLRQDLRAPFVPDALRLAVAAGSATAELRGAGPAVAARVAALAAVVRVERIR